ncbi:MAG TPA: helix-turn-helix domain-containing protein [Firmicutes bacterium]|nr:helix-turn-helix domain-containing protein [Bacillota bacterium]
MSRVTMPAKQAAEYLGMSYWKLLEYAKAGKIPHVRLPGKLLFRRESLDKWLEQQEQASLHCEPESVPGQIRKLS